MGTIIKNITEFEDLIANGYIIKNKHPKADLWIYNYSQKTQYERFWNEYTLLCRELILDKSYKLVAKGLSKFFNIEEVGYENIPKTSYEVFEKMDGSLGILYWLNNKPFIATRSSFNSEQSIVANKLLKTKYANIIANLDKNNTYVFEIIYPSNRIVVDYGAEEKLVLLAIVNNTTLKEEKLVDVGFSLPKTFKGTSIENLKDLDWQNSEGFVIRFANEYRVKIKFENYIALHKIVTQISTLTIWEELQKGNGLTEEWLNNVPDEFYKWVHTVEQDLYKSFKHIEDIAKQDFKVLKTEKETAAYYFTCKYPHVLFSMKNGKDYAPRIWRMIRPTFEKAYRQ